MFNKEQQQAIDVSIDKDILVSAAAGSGKTTVLTEKVKNILGNKLIDISELLVLTFTNNAAHHMKEEIIKACGDNIPELKHKITSAHIQTFDSLFQEIVKQYSTELHIPSTFIIANDFVIKAKRIEILDDILDEWYANPKASSRITSFLQKYNIKDDSKSKNVILDVSIHLDQMIPSERKQFIDSYLTGERFDRKWYDSLVVWYKNLTKCNDSFIDDDYQIYKNTKDDVLLILEIAQALSKRLFLYKKSANSFTYEDIAQFALQILTDSDFASAAKAIRNRFKYILVDEYQDTNDLQEKVLLSLLQPKEDGSVSHIFAVGDKKQSIYGFRNSNVELFNAREETYDSDNRVIYMNTNYRSCKEIINDINYIFSSYLTRECGGVAYGENKKNQLVYGNYKTPDKLKFPGVVRIIPNEMLPITPISQIRQWEVKAIIQDILNKCKLGYKYKDFTILTRTKSEFDLYQRSFAMAGIPLNNKIASNLNEIDAIMLIQSFITLFSIFEQDVENESINEQIKHMFVSIARSYISPYEYPSRDQKIYDLIKNNQYKSDPLFKRIQSFFNETKKLSFTNRFIKLIDEFEIISKLYLIGEVRKNIAKIESLFQIILSFEKAGEGLSTFVDILDIISKYNINVEDNTIVDLEDAVSLMTIHQAKGLENKIIYLPNASNHLGKPPVFDKPDYVFSKKYGIILPFYDVHGGDDKKGIMQTPAIPKNRILADLAEAEAEAANISEHRRLFYVALTRAKEQICIVGQPCKSKSDTEMKEETMYGMLFNLPYDNDENESNSTHISFKSGSFADNWYSIEPKGELELTKKPTLDEMIEVNDEIINSPIRQHLRASMIYDSSEDNKILLEKGTLYHLLMEIVDLNTKDTSFIKNKRDREIIDKVLKLQLFKDIAGAKYYKEYGYYDKNLLTTGFIDLLAIKDNQYYIIDYKFKNIEKPEYINQLLTYRENIKKIFNIKDDNIHMFLVGLASGKFKEVN